MLTVIDCCIIIIFYPRQSLFSAHTHTTRNTVTLAYCGQTVRWIRMPLGTDVGLSPGHIVLGGDPAARPRALFTERGTAPPHFGPCLLSPISVVYKMSSKVHLKLSLFRVLINTCLNRLDYAVIYYVCDLDQFLCKYAGIMDWSTSSRLMRVHAFQILVQIWRRWSVFDARMFVHLVLSLVQLHLLIDRARTVDGRLFNYSRSIVLLVSVSSHKTQSTFSSKVVLTSHSLANWDSCPTPAKSEAMEYLQAGPTEIRYSIAWTIFVYL